MSQNTFSIILKAGVQGQLNKILMAKEINKSLKANKVWTLPVFQLLRYLIRIVELIVKPKTKY